MQPTLYAFSHHCNYTDASNDGQEGREQLHVDKQKSNTIWVIKKTATLCIVLILVVAVVIEMLVLSTV